MDVHTLAHLISSDIFTARQTHNILIVRPNPMVTKQDLMRILEFTELMQLWEQLCVADLAVNKY